MRRSVRLVFVVACLVLAPSFAFAQASITGAVRDSSGAVLPGVNVEAASDALIEKVRLAVTDGTGQYRIVDLRPGTYSVTVTLPGFRTVKRDGIELTGQLNASVNFELSVGSLEETITVTGESPIVDVQSVRRQTTVTDEVITSIPMARSWAATAVLIPSIATQAGAAADIQVTPQMTVFGGAGGRSNEGRLQVDGLNVGAALNGGGVSTYTADISNAQEIVMTTSGGLGEAEVGGPTLSIVPKTGGNTTRGNIYLSGVPEGWVGSNYSPELQAAGLSTPGALVRQWDFTGGVGGPIKKDRLWYYFTARDQGQWRTIPGTFPNLNAGRADQWLYVPDTTKSAQGRESWQVGTLRLTLQASAKNKFNFYWDEQLPCNGATYDSTTDGCRQQPSDGDIVVGPLGLGGLSAVTSPEVVGYLRTIGARVQQVTWTSTVTNRLLLEAGLGTQLARWGPFESPGNPTRDLIRVTDQLSGRTYRSANWLNAWNGTHTWRASASYVTGAHSMKVGYIGGYLEDERKNFTNNHNLTFRLNNGAPNQITQTALPFQTFNNVGYHATYVQDQWTRGRMTLQGALRFDFAKSWFREQQIGPSNYLPFSTVFPEQDGVTGYKNITPRAGFAYDVFGNGKTAVKINIGQYLEPASNGNGVYSSKNPTSRISTTVNRAWTDVDGDFVPDCDLTNGQAQDLRGSGGDFCGVISNLNFGLPVFSNTIDEAIMGGWGARPTDWQFGASVQQEIFPRVSVEVGYFRRWAQNFFVQENTNVSAADYTAFSIVAPSDSRLPNGGGYTVSGLYSITPEAITRAPNNFITSADNYGGQKQMYNGLLVNVSARPRNGLTVQGGMNLGKTVLDMCAVRDQQPEATGVGGSGITPAVGLTNPNCLSDPGFVTRVTGLASYTVPTVDVLVSTTFRSDQGASLNANWAAPASLVAAALGRPVAGGGSTVTINLAAPGDVWGDRVNEIDLRIAKVLRFGRTRATIGLDIFNLVNSAAVLTYNQNFSTALLSGAGSWRQPQSVLTPRFYKIGAQIDF
jgi:hypothetical protein